MCSWGGWERFNGFQVRTHSVHEEQPEGVEGLLFEPLTSVAL